MRNKNWTDNDIKEIADQLHNEILMLRWAG